MILTLTLLALAGPALPQDTSPPTDAVPTTIRMVELDGDGWLDRLALGADGSVTVALNRGARLFEPVAQELPNVFVADVLAADLDADGHPDLYLVSPGVNVALLGDGTGAFIDATGELGLVDAAVGLRAEQLDLDADGVLDVLLHNEHGDVVFWGSETGVYERDAAMPAQDELENLRWPASSVPIPPSVQPPGAPHSREAPAPTSSKDSGKTVARPAGAGAVGGTIEARVPVPPGTEQATPIPFFCAKTIEDMSTGSCISADSTPTIGRLFPLSERFNIHPTYGSVGIGAVGDDEHIANLNVIGNSSGAAVFIAPDTEGGGTGQIIFANDRRNLGDRFRIFYSGTSNDLSFRSSEYDGMVIQSDGDVGVGTTSPQADLHVMGDVAAYTQMLISTRSPTVDGTASLMLMNGPFSGDGFEFWFNGSQNELSLRSHVGSTQTLLHVEAGGFVGIGTTNPQARLHVAGPGGLIVQGGESSLTQEAWTNPTLQNGWLDYGAGYSNARYFKDSVGVVHLQGTVQSGAFAAAIFTLPAEYRPDSRRIFAVVTNPNALGRVDVLPDGSVLAVAGSNTFISLEGITFRAE